MVLVLLPDGTTCECRLQQTEHGLRLVRACASYDLHTMLQEAGWRILEVKTAAEIDCLTEHSIAMPSA
jgi:hypothetical protein